MGPVGFLLPRAFAAPINIGACFDAPPEPGFLKREAVHTLKYPSNPTNVHNGHNIMLKAWQKNSRQANGPCGI